MSAEMTHPDGRTEDIHIGFDKDDLFTTKFLPVMNGIHALSVKKDGKDVEGNHLYIRDFNSNPKDSCGNLFEKKYK